MRPEAETPYTFRKLDAQGRAYATGKRKDAIARVWIKPGSGKIIVNGKDVTEYFGRPVLQMVINQPINCVPTAKASSTFICTVTGGGLSGQAGAVRHGISKALTYYEPELRAVLKKGGFLTRDSRVSSNVRNTVAPKPAVRSSSPSVKPGQAKIFRREAAFGPLFLCVFLVSILPQSTSMLRVVINQF